MQKLVQGTSTRSTESREIPVASSSGDPAVDTPKIGTAKLVVPMTRRAESWWLPTFWSIARPTDFVYGDCAWGLECAPVWLSVSDWLTNVVRREELEYDMIDDV